MATKKKAAKPAKKTANGKKIAPAKKPASKTAHSSGGSKSVKKSPAAKSIGKSVAKKVASSAASKKSAHIQPKKTAVSNFSKPPANISKAPGNISKPAANLSKSAARSHAPAALSKTHAPAAKAAPAHAPAKPTSTPVPIGKTTAVALPTAPTTATVKPEAKKPTPPARPVKVVIPEIKTKTVRKYEPEFTKSVLDTPQEEQTGPTMRYSDAELGEFRELINRKLDAAKKELAYLQGLITRKDEMGGDNDDARYMTMEDGSMSMEREQLSQMASRQITFIDHLEKALMRIENKTYGICRVTGKLIDKARLRAVPHATLSIEAKQMMNK
jgi:RNA polymerase-binding transcription factor DksA